MSLLTIDHREKDLKSVFPNAEFKNLDLGDIHIKYKEQTFLLIERKTMKDLIASVNDGRYREQKKRLLESGIPKERIMYLLEGRIDDIPGQMKTLFGMIINTIFRDKIQIIRFETIEETIYFIKRIMEKLEKNDPNIIDININIINSTIKTNLENNDTQILDTNSENKNEQKDSIELNNEYLSTIKLKKKDNLTTNNCSILQLAQIPGMSVSNAQVILDKYKSIAEIINSFNQLEESKRSMMVSDIEISLSNGKTRKLGKVLSERIYQYLFNISQKN